MGSETMPKSKELVSSSSSASDSDSEVDKKAKRKKQVAPEKPVKKQKTGESSKGAASSKQSSNRDENMFQLPEHSGHTETRWKFVSRRCNGRVSCNLKGKTVENVVNIGSGGKQSKQVTSGDKKSKSVATGSCFAGGGPPPFSPSLLDVILPA
ncbi:uncharacterized protein LOC115949181 isoform X1 [Geospiza fortis]|uniref:Uncharacterized protein LOC115949181 isoform X1 n=1 Tax=Geospiza fortis TaxID=48883 RepID=A0A8N5F6C4_GEOFO|nr:uncharacterized protein LOC115949181 isoform X1 [Geospiza fortis]